MLRALTCANRPPDERLADATPDGLLGTRDRLSITTSKSAARRR